MNCTEDPVMKKYPKYRQKYIDLTKGAKKIIEYIADIYNEKEYVVLSSLTRIVGTADGMPIYDVCKELSEKDLTKEDLHIALNFLMQEKYSPETRYIWCGRYPKYKQDARPKGINPKVICFREPLEYEITKIEKGEIVDSIKVNELNKIKNHMEDLYGKKYLPNVFDLSS